MYALHYELAKALQAEREAEIRRLQAVAVARRRAGRTVWSWARLWPKRTRTSRGVPAVAAG